MNFYQSGINTPIVVGQLIMSATHEENPETIYISTEHVLHFLIAWSDPNTFMLRVECTNLKIRYNALFFQSTIFFFLESYLDFLVCLFDGVFNF